MIFDQLRREAAMTESYRDQVVIQFFQVRDLTDPRVVDAYEIVINPGGTIDLDWLSDELGNPV